ncbi:MAG: glycine dehydrogenase, partial [Deltaproteobacteria bacterium]|nr:glycine dehydrogenase [Deltaproteobacteria bacterium]
MRYLPHTEAEIAEMLRVVGAGRLEDLFAAVPSDCRLDRPLDLPEPLSEPELLRHAAGLAGPAPAHRVFLGAGAYDHHVPAAIPPLFSRAEFLTAYTPYQPEVSQGTLQGIYEYQTLVSRLLGMEISNASVYDGASALAEALLLAIRVTRRHQVALSRAVHPAYRQVVRTYLEPGGYEVVELPWAADGRTDLSGLDAEGDLAAVAVQSPNFFGCIEDLEAACAAARARGALAVVTFTE